MKTCLWPKKAFSKSITLVTVILLSFTTSAIAQHPKWMLGEIENKTTKDTTILIIADKQPVIVTSMKSNCSCLKAKIDKHAAQVGDTLRIYLRYNAKDKGFLFKKVELTGKGLPWYEIVVRGEVK